MLLLCRLHRTEAVDDFLRRIGLIEVDADHPDTRSVAVHRALNCCEQIGRNRAAILVQDRRHVGARNDVAHRGFRNRPDRVRRIGKVEQELRGVFNVPHHLEMHVHDVLVVGQHQPGVILPTLPVADIRRAFGRGRHHFRIDDRPRRKVQAGPADAVELAKEQLDRALFRLHRIDRGEHPQHHRHRSDAQPDQPRVRQPVAARPGATPAATATPAHQQAQLVLPLFHDLFNIGQLRAVARLAPPAATVVIATTLAAAAPGSATISCHRPVVPILMSGMGHGPKYLPCRDFQAFRTGVFMVTSSSDMVGCTATVRSKSSFVAPILMAIAANWIISPAFGATM
ncbi:hypothetical protein GALL_482630 [mine drainage metagenome]|uniref:Uncharacterized protein n=1 Tax=mine drainage metagenome TaxID=410659 RepID=A0A1J5PQW9_9ZZZZ